MNPFILGNSLCTVYVYEVKELVQIMIQLKKKEQEVNIPVPFEDSGQVTTHTTLYHSVHHSMLIPSID